MQENMASAEREKEGQSKRQPTGRRKGPVITWTIHNFSHASRHEDLTSCQFDTVYGTQWRMRISTTLEPVLVRDCKKGPKQVTVGFQFNLITATNAKVFVSEPRTRTFKDGDEYGSEVTLEDLLGDERMRVLGRGDVLTLQCHMWREGVSDTRRDCSSTLKLPKKHETEEMWFSAFHKKKVDPRPLTFSSPRKTYADSEEDLDTSWLYFLYDRFDEENQDTMTFQLKQNYDQCTVIQSRWMLLDKQGRATGKQSELMWQHFVGAEHRGGEMSWDIEREYLEGNRDSLLLKDKKVLIRFEANYGHDYEEKTVHAETRQYRPAPKVGSTLSEDMSRLLLSPEGCQGDVTLVSGDGVSLSAHRTILCARSAVFAAMMERDMAERQSGTVNIADMGGETLRQLLSFLYTGRLDKEEELDCDTLAQLYTAGDKYGVLALKKRCGVLMRGRVSVDTVCDVLEFSDLHSDDGMRGAALDALHESAEDVLCSAEWRELTERRKDLTEHAMELLRLKRMQK